MKLTALKHLFSPLLSSKGLSMSIALLCLMIGFYGAWQIRGWKETAKLAACETQQTKAIADQHNESAQHLRKRESALTTLRHQQSQENAHVEDLIHRRAYFDAH